MKTENSGYCTVDVRRARHEDIAGTQFVARWWTVTVSALHRRAGNEAPGTA